MRVQNTSLQIGLSKNHFSLRVHIKAAVVSVTAIAANQGKSLIKIREQVINVRTQRQRISGKKSSGATFSLLACRQGPGAVGDLEITPQTIDQDHQVLLPISRITKQTVLEK